ncbi:MAG: aldolase catalytic domain-containing protein [Bacteroidales bacterium]|jgi:4-hydroxy 2-oxovalerate aldolase|nr:aldolase catalytic domain-containing protein [Bacteroidales bacterium]
MKQIKLLDCTLRDGGFVNNWEFGDIAIRDIISRLDKAGVDIVEVGYLNDGVEFDMNRTLYPDVKAANKMFRNIKVEKSMVVAMIDFGDCSINRISPCEEVYLDGIRVTLKKNEIDDALAFCLMLKNLGYKVFVQPVSITAYSDAEILDLLAKVNVLNPYALSIVDTYGLMIKKDLIRYFYLIDNNTNKDILIGYHSHNNLQLAFSNCVELLNESGVKRGIVLDTTLYGMGKSAGNAQTELVANYLNTEFGTTYSINTMLNLIDLYIVPIYHNNPWGYKIEYFINAMNNCHPNYVQYLLEKNTLSIESINEIVSSIEKTKKLKYDERLIDGLYWKYQSTLINDDKACEWLRELINDRIILIISPGATLNTHKKTILDFCENNDPVVFSINFLPEDYPVNCLFVSNPRRYNSIIDYYTESKQKPYILATSNIVQAAIPLDYIFNLSSLLNNERQELLNSTLLFLRLLMKLGEKKVSICGFDGYSNSEENEYVSISLHTVLDEKEKIMQNEYIKKQVNIIRKNIEIDFITPSYYIEMENARFTPPPPPCLSDSTGF